MPVPKVAPVKHSEYTCTQSKYGDIVPRRPLRGMLLAPSFSGKSVLIQSLILDIYRGCYQRIYVWSPTIHLDSVWKPVKEYIAKEIRPSDKEKYTLKIIIPKNLKKSLKDKEGLYNTKKIKVKHIYLVY